MKKDSIARSEADFVTALLSAEMIQAMDRFIWEEAPGMTRSDVLKEAFNEWCIKRGYIHPRDAEPSARSSASN